MSCLASWAISVVLVAQNNKSSGCMQPSSDSLSLWLRSMSVTGVEVGYVKVLVNQRLIYTLQLVTADLEVVLPLLAFIDFATDSNAQNRRSQRRSLPFPCTFYMTRSLAAHLKEQWRTTLPWRLPRHCVLRCYIYRILAWWRFRACGRNRVLKADCRSPFLPSYADPIFKILGEHTIQTCWHSRASLQLKKRAGKGFHPGSHAQSGQRQANIALFRKFSCKQSTRARHFERCFTSQTLVSLQVSASPDEEAPRQTNRPEANARNICEVNGESRKTTIASAKTEKQKKSRNKVSIQTK